MGSSCQRVAMEMNDVKLSTFRGSVPDIERSEFEVLAGSTSSSLFKNPILEVSCKQEQL
jgi:hypothetical protein